MRAGPWRWLLTALFIGYLFHTVACPCEVFHPHEQPTKYVHIQRTLRIQRAQPPHVKARVPRQLPIAAFPVALPRVGQYLSTQAANATFHLAPGIATPLAARGPPPRSPHNALDLADEH